MGGSCFLDIWDFLIATSRTPSPIATLLCSISWPSVHLCHLLPYLIFPPFPSHLQFFPSTSIPLFPLVVLFPLLNRMEAFILWSSVLLSFMRSVSYIVCIPYFLPNVLLSVSKYKACSFVMELPHSGSYFLVSVLNTKCLFWDCRLKLNASLYSLDYWVISQL